MIRYGSMAPAATRTKEEWCEYINRFRQRRRAAAFSLLGRTCVTCGSSEDLEFDHIDPTGKVDCVANMWTASASIFFRELSKCQVLCHRCHRVKSVENHDVSIATHGGSLYRRGCRCPLCVEGNKARCKERRRRLNGQPLACRARPSGYAGSTPAVYT